MKISDKRRAGILATRAFRNKTTPLTRSPKKPNGIVIYEGPSQIDGAPIVVIATGLAKRSNNSKTGGDLIQTWILRADMSPIDAANIGADSSICGDCPHRGIVVEVDGVQKNKERSCYVTLFQAPLNIWKSWKRGIYPTARGDELRNRGVRLGAYGDPAAAPFSVWESILRGSSFHTGYTHQWKRFPDFSKFCMASCDSVGDRTFAKLMGFRTFRVSDMSGAPVDKTEISCPASAESGHKTTCDACQACGGTSSKARVDITIRAHGTAGKIKAFQNRESVTA